MGAEHRGGTQVARRQVAGRGPAVVLVIAALAAACGSTAPTPTLPGGSAGPAGPSPSAGSATAPSPRPSAPAAAWSAVVIDDVAPVARLEPTASGAGGIATTTAFRLTSLDGTAPRDLVARLRVDPPVQLAVAELDGPAAVLRPASALRPATIYRFSLLGTDGTLAGAWAAQTAGPLRLVESIPGDGATDVPPDAGIELVFDQPGVSASDLERHLVVRPAIEGHIQVAGRQLAYVPSTPLARATLYTVTITTGLPIAGTDQKLAADETVRFETSGRVPTKVAVGPVRDFLESTPRDAAAIALWVDSEDDLPPPARIPVTVHRLAGLGGAEQAWRAVAAQPAWTRVTTTPAVDTAGLPRVVAGRLPVRGGNGEWWLRLPRPLPAGWYLVTIAWGGIPHQAVLQVTDLATYGLVTTSRSAVWLNDLRTTDPIRGASVSLGGRDLGRTNSRGLLTARTPTVLGRLGPNDRSRLLEVRTGSRVAFQPVSIEGCGACADTQDPETFWHLLSSDRYRYRSTDTVNAWGIVRDRATGRVPASLHVRLVASQSDTTGAPPISELDVTPDARGAFAASVPLHDLPAGPYRLVVRAGKTPVGELWFDVGTITKPGFQLAITPDRPAVIAGESMTYSVHGSFFEGTPVSGIPLTISAEDGANVAATTSADGDASASLEMHPSGDEQWGVQGVQVTPTQPEEAAITAATFVAVFAGDRLVDTAGHVASHTLTVTGRVTAVDLSTFDGVDEAALYGVDPHGAPVGGATVTLRVIEHRSSRKQTGTRYDFILKRVIPLYEDKEIVTVVGRRTVVTRADGTYRVTLPVAGGDRAYEILAATVDDAHRSIKADAYANGRDSLYVDTNPRLTRPRSDEEGAYSVGDTVTLRFEGGVARPRADRYLFAVAQQGLRSVEVQGGSTFRTAFDAKAVPAIDIFGVRFTGFGYEAAYPVPAGLRLADRTLSVDVSADRDRYAPGDTATVTVRTRDAAGHPVAASVFLQAVDEKLFATGDASLFNPIDTLYQPLSDGVLAEVRSHQTPEDDFNDGKGGGDTTGGGGRGDFRDWLVGRLVETDASGVASLDIPLSDDLTSWHVTAEAVDAKLQAGAGEHLLPVSLPLFAEATIPATLLVTDEPVIRVRAFGGGLHAGDPVTITVSSDSLGMAPVVKQVPAFGAVEVPLPALKPGQQVIRIKVEAGDQHDELVRTVEVLPSRAERDVTTWAPLLDHTAVPAGKGFTHLVLVDAGRGRVVPILEDLAGSGTARSDLAIAAGVADRTLAGVFGLPATPADAQPDLAPFVIDDGSLAIVPWGSGDLDATALAGMSRDPRLDPAAVGEGLHTFFDNPDETRPRRLLALAGLAGLGEPVLADVHAAATATDLTVPEQVSLALAALYAGDEDLARTIEHRLLRQHGAHLGPWTRLDTRSGDDPDLQTARLAIVAASLGEPVAAEMDAWVAANPPRTTSIALERALAARGWAERVPASSGVAALTVDGTRREITVGQGEAQAVDLTPGQAASASLEPVSGAVLVVTTRAVALGDAGLTAPVGQTLERQVRPAGAIGETDTVRVTLRVHLGTTAGSECWRLTDLAPSGLAPVGQGWMNDDGLVVGPDRIDGQRVEFCVLPDAARPDRELSYLARVVDPGRYVWEPAVLQSSVAPEQGVITPSDTVTITPAGG
jgi:hypothetical protein